MLSFIRAGLVIILLLALIACSSKPVKPLAKSWVIPASLIEKSRQSPLEISVIRQTNNHIDKSGFYFIDTGVDAFSAMAGLISAAKRSIDLQSFIYHDDRTGRLLAYKLLQAADRGVRVRILLDDFFSSSKTSLLATLNAHRNIELRFFNPVSTVGWVRPIALVAKFSKVTRRMHNKAFIVDDRVAIVGGRNVGDVYYAMHGDYQFTDLDVLSVGPAVNNISGSFDTFWNSRWVVGVAAYSQFSNQSAKSVFVKKKLLQLRKNATQLRNSQFMNAVRKSGIATKLLQGHLPMLWSKSKLFYDPPEKVTGRRKHRKNYLMRQIMPYLAQAKSEILIVTPYFVPRYSGLRWLKRLRKKGIKITVLTNSFASNDIPFAYIGYERYRRKLLNMGVKLYEFKPSAESTRRKGYSWLKHLPKAGLHAKLIIIDGKKLIIGSPNINARSRNLDTEIAMLINNSDISRQMGALFKKLIRPANSYRVVLRKRDDYWREADDLDLDEEQEQQLVWITHKRGKRVQYRQEPKTWFLGHLGVFFIGLFPIEGQL